MLGSQLLFAGSKSTQVQGLCFNVLALVHIEACQGIESSRGAGMLMSQLLLANGKCAQVQRFRLGVLALLLI